METFTHIAVSLTRFFIASFGFLLVYIALFLHEDEEGRLQNRMEELWVKMDDLRVKAISKEARFLKEVIRLVNLGLDSLLGRRLFSWRVVLVTICYSVASFFITIGFIFNLRKEWQAYLVIFGTGAAFWILGTLSITATRPPYIQLWMIGVNVLIVAELVWLFKSADLRQFLGQTIVLLIALLCDIIFIAVNRAIIQFSSTLSNFTQLVIMLLINILLGAIYICPIWVPILFSYRPFGAIGFYVATTNLFTTLSAFSIVIMLAIALAHRLAWPLVERPIYAIVRHEAVRKPVRLLSLAFLVLTWAIPAWEPFWDVMAKLK
jgi:hypothetical protein